MENFDCVSELKENEADICNSACDALLRISRNILSKPTEQKFRSLKISSSVVTTQLLPAAGAMECLFAMGFKECEGDVEALILPLDDPLDNLKRVHDDLEKLRAGSNPPPSLPAAPAPTAPPPSLPARAAPPPSPLSELKFVRKLESGLATARRYEDPFLQKRARALVPIKDIETNARNLLAGVKMYEEGAASTSATAEAASKSASVEAASASATVEAASASATVEAASASATAEAAPALALEDLQMLLLIRWFKRDFFKWVNKPACDWCGSSTSSFGVSTPNDAEMMWDAGQVEIYSCDDCHEETRFPRYNNPGKLLETRRGRCGEWANCFGLISRACGFETRYVLDWTDHVWTEYYSKSQDRWVHGDTCEEGHDKPLLYEHGWGKKLTYVFAFSVDDIQDVTWRYTTKQREVLWRRTEIDEANLVSVILRMRAKLQSSVSPSRKEELTRRCIKELAEFSACDSRQVKKGELSGRESGSLSWRISRGEASLDSVAGKEIRPTKREFRRRRMRIRYFVVGDLYIRGGDDEKRDLITGWYSLCFESKNVVRKVENDWRMVYLARAKGTEEGTISWKFNLEGSGFKIKLLQIRRSEKIFENASISWTLSTESFSTTLSPQDGETTVMIPWTEVDLKDCISFEIKASISGGVGSNAWQHGQLFRTHMEDEELTAFDLILNFS